MSGIFGSRTIKGTRITDFSETTATVGTVIPFGYGRFTSGGNVIWAPLPPKEHRHTQRVGKGGTRQESFTYTLSYAVAFAKGPIAGYWWIKRNGKVVYTQDPNAPIEDHEYAAKWLERATLYYGTMEQLPDSTIESYEGTGEVSAFHRLAYIVVEDDDVTDGGGAVPTYEACVIADGLSYGTSPPYPVIQEEHLQSTGSPARHLMMDMVVEELSSFGSALDGDLRDIKLTYEVPPEELMSSGMAVDGDLRDVKKTYDGVPEELESTGVATDGILHNTKVSYSVDPEELQSTGMALDGSIS